MTGRWAFELVSGDSEVAADWTALTDLPSATSRRVSLFLDQPSVVGLTLSGYSPDALLVEELRSDVIAYRNGVALARGRVVGSQDSVTGTSYSLSLTCMDYKDVLRRRFLLDGDAELSAYSSTVPNPAVDQEEIAWALINRTQSRTGGDLGITRGSSATGVLRNRTYEPGASIGDLLTNLGNVDDGFDWDIDPATMAFRLFYPSRGSASTFLLEWGGAVESVQRAVGSSSYANVVRLNGAQPAEGGTPAYAVATGTPSIEGRWEAQLGDTGAIESDTVTERSLYELSKREVITPSYSLKLNTELWTGPDDMWLGDTAHLYLNIGRLAVDTTVRVLGFDFDIDNDGYESVTVTVGALTPEQAYYRDVRDTYRRLSDLERR